MKPASDTPDVHLPRVTKGKRPYFFEDQSVDQLMTFILELMAEVMVLRDRQNTLERMLDERGFIVRNDIEDHNPGPEEDAEKQVRHAEFVKRVLRIHVPNGRPEA